MQTNFSLSVLRSYITEKTHLFLLLSYWDQVGHIKQYHTGFPVLKFFYLFPGLSSKKTKYEAGLASSHPTQNEKFLGVGWENWREKSGHATSTGGAHEFCGGTNYVTSAFKLLLILISSFPMSFSPSLGCYFCHLITTFTGKKPYFHIKGNCQEIQDLMGEKCWVSALPISCSFRMRTGKQR